MTNRIVKIGVFYDGGYFFHVSNYYAFYHQRRERLSISGLHEFIRSETAKRENVDLHFCQIVDAHYFRGRYTTNVMESKGWLRGERLFEDVLMFNGVTTHFWPMMESGEKGVDVAFALEAFELAQAKRFDVCVLVAGDGDYVPLVRKLHMLGTRVMVCGWSFEYYDEKDQRRETHASRQLLSEASYPLQMTELLENMHKAHDPMLNQLFVSRGYDDEDSGSAAAATEDITDALPDAGDSAGDGDADGAPDTSAEESTSPAEVYEGSVVLLNQGWGFITPDTGDVDIFFHYGDLLGMTFDQLKFGDRVSYTLGTNERGAIAKTIVRL